MCVKLDEADGTVLGCGICSFSDIPRVCLHVAMTEACECSPSATAREYGLNKDHAAQLECRYPALPSAGVIQCR